MSVWLNSSLAWPAWGNPAMSGLWPPQEKACQPEDTALVWGISHQRGSWGQRLEFLLAAILEDVLVIADNAKARMSIWNSTLTCHQAPSECAMELALQLLSAAVPPRPSLQHGLTLLRGWNWQDSAIASTILGSPVPHWPLPLEQLARPTQEQDGLPSPSGLIAFAKSSSTWSSLSNILYMCFMYKNENICFDCLFL